MIICIKTSWRVNKKCSDMVLILIGIDNVRCRYEKTFSPATNVKNVCNNRLRVNILLKRCIQKSFVCLIH